MTAMPTPVVVPHIPDATQLVHTVRIGLPVATVWSAMQDVRLVAECVPGARLLAVDGDQLRGEVRASLGPIETLFAGEGHVAFVAAEQRAEIAGDGRDSRTGTRLSGRGVVRLRELDATTTAADVTMEYSLRGPLAQFARGSVVQEFAAAIATTFAGNLEARLTGGDAPVQRRLAFGTLLLRALWRRLRALLSID
jgi:carbon-monoxide dehydrogenase small subunit